MFLSADRTMTIIQGDAMLYRFQLLNANSTAYDYTGKQVEWRLAANTFGSPHIAVANFDNGKLIADDDPTSGWISFDIRSPETATWPTGQYVYEIKVIQADVTYTIVQGQFALLGQIT